MAAAKSLQQFFCVNSSSDPLLNLNPAHIKTLHPLLYTTTQVLIHLIFLLMEGLKIKYEIPFELLILASYILFSFFSQLHVACSSPPALGWTFSWNWVESWQLQEYMTEKKQIHQHTCMVFKHNLKFALNSKIWHATTPPSSPPKQTHTEKKKRKSWHVNQESSTSDLLHGCTYIKRDEKLRI